MTSYFDDKAREISDAARAGDYTLAQKIEDQVIADVRLVTGDREFPDDLRERSNGLIATLCVQCPSGVPTKGERTLRSAKRSSLVDALHSLFHDLARRRVETRFGLLTDNPRAILAARAANLEEGRSLSMDG